MIELECMENWSTDGQCFSLHACIHSISMTYVCFWCADLRAKKKEYHAQYYINKIKHDPVRYAKYKARSRDYRRRKRKLIQNIMDFSHQN